MTCNKCGKEIDKDFNLCPYCGENLKISKKPTKELKETPDNDLEEEPENEHGSGIIKFIFTLVCIILVGALIFVFTSTCPSKKTPPTITRHGKTCDIDGTITGYYFSIKANDNYEDVTIEYTFYTHSGDIFARNKLTKKNCEKGKTYSLEVQLYQTHVPYIDFGNVLCKIDSFS